MKLRRVLVLVLVLALHLTGCSDDDGSDGSDGNAVDASAEDASLDAGVDAGPPVPLSTDHCTYAPLPPTAGAGGTVEPGPIRVGVAERPLDLPVGAALGGNTSRAELLDGQGRVDDREVALSGSFTPSVGYETIPKAKVVAITAGDETVVLIRTDTIFGDDTVTHELTDRLGPEYAGKLIWLSSHTHTAVEQYSADTKFQVGGGPVSALVREQLIDRMEETIQAALGARVPARIGIATEMAFDPEDRVSYDRRGENDFLYGGEERKDMELALIRIDHADGRPLAILPIFGVHSAILDDDVSVFSTDASGMFERTLEEEFDEQVMVVHLQGAAGDVLGASSGHLEYAEDEPRWDFARNEENGRWALPMLLEVWERAGEAMEDELPMEVVTRSIEMGPDWTTFTVRDGALEYAPWDGVRPADRIIFDEDGAIVSPIDEFNAPGGASLCGEAEPGLLAFARMPNVQELRPYLSCADLTKAVSLLGSAFDFDFEEPPLCVSTRTTITAWRLGDFLFGTAPGEPLVPWRDFVQEGSPWPEDRTFVLGYAQGHNGYILTPEDWLQGGFEPTINSWGPLEGQYIGERLIELLQLAVTDEREDATTGGADRVVAVLVGEQPVLEPDSAPLAGTVPDTVPAEVYLRGTVQPTNPQPEPILERVHGVARFVWIGEDPLTGTPRVTLEREVDGAFEPVRRRSGRVVEDLDMIVVWTPLPLRLSTAEDRTHYWSVEWQAVSWFGADGLASLADRPGLPLGRYRFHVEGTGYALDSEPFEVGPATMEVGTSLDGSDLIVDVGYQPVEGWRLMNMTGLANRYVPSEAGPFAVEVELAAGGAETFSDVAAEAPGRVRVTPGGAVSRVTITDRFGNVGTLEL